MKVLTLISLIVLSACSHQLQPKDQLRQAVLQETNDATVAYRSAFADLNNDNQKDAIILLQGPNWCGSGGCTMMVFENNGGHFQVVSQSSITRAPIRVSSHAQNGWKHLIVWSKGNALMIHNGTQYPLNPSIQPTAGRKDIAQSTIVINHQ